MLTAVCDQSLLPPLPPLLPLRLCPQPPGPPSSQVSVCKAFAVRKGQLLAASPVSRVAPREAAPLRHPPELSVTAGTLRHCNGCAWLVRPTSYKLLEGQARFLFPVMSFISSVVSDSL